MSFCLHQRNKAEELKNLQQQSTSKEQELNQIRVEQEQIREDHKRMTIQLFEKTKALEKEAALSEKVSKLHN